MADISANRYDMTMWQGSTFGMNVSVQYANGSTQSLTGYSARMQIRSTYGSASVAEALTSANGEITVDGTNGTLVLALPAVRTKDIFVDLNDSSKPPRTKYVYDLEIVDNAGTVSKLLYGDLSVYGEVTR
jgi:hypothetical protein